MMPKNEIKREEVTFEIRAESFKEGTKKFFSDYENPSGCEDRLEVCLIREGFRAVSKAEEEINRLKAEIYQLQETIITGRFTSPTAIRAQQSWHRQNSENIKRLNEENEKLQEKLEGMIEAAHIAMKVAVAEAIKEFAERLCEDWRKDDILCDVNIEKWILDTYKEMVGAEDGNTEKDS